MSRRSFLSRITAFGFGAFLSSPSQAKQPSNHKPQWNFGTNTPEWEPLEVTTGDSLLVSANVGGIPIRAMLDSGSGITVLSTEFAAKMGLGKGEQRTIGGLSSQAPVELVRDVVVHLGGKTRRLPYAVIANLNDASAASGRPIEALLGADMFAGSSIALDFGNQRFAVADTHTFVPGPGWVSLTLEQGSKKDLFTRASIAGLAPVPLMLDLGSATALMVSEPYVREHGLLDGKHVSTAALGGIDGIRINEVFTISTISIAGLTITDVPAMSMKEWLPTATVGNIGLPLLAQFDVIFDLSGGTIWLRPLDPAHRLPMPKDRSGFGLAASSTGLTVVHVAPNSPAQEGGWSIGERIVGVNGVPVDENYTHGKLWRWRFGAPGTVTKLKTADGQVRVLTLANYY